ncbi:DUF4139 domain-containing protein [Algoriphagus aquimarinus]|uniref:DUF4139 domain-containing protein n=1 Tax=Algoriphagus aquimarinus TaxID=237018 RepID=A0A5C7B2F6_9BACT|nr:DUF4139 domain-containing protein [Algoriphagus aquimarinus]TXE14614.1 DUF4139 domain-containing protein [Algoriphagus aquimarinus]
MKKFSFSLILSLFAFAAFSQEIKETPFKSEITVEALALSGGKLDPQTGKVTWQLTIPAGQQQVIPLQYEVKYPKKEKVILD